MLCFCQFLIFIDSSPRLHLVVGLVQRAGSVVDQVPVPGWRREPGRLGGLGSSDSLYPGGLEGREEVVQIEDGWDEFLDLLEGGSHEVHGEEGQLHETTDPDTNRTGGVGA